MHAALQLDRFGIVAHVLAKRGCTAEKCDLANFFGDPSHVLANLRDHVFDDQVTKFTAAWNGAPRGATTAEAAAAPHARPAAVVSPQYDFPSADSIPPVNIMMPEPGQRNAAAPPAAPSVGGSRPATTPIPPRRPPQRTPVAASRPPVARPAAPAAPVAIGEAPTTDAAGTPSPQ
jgi:hypothetical protein